MFNSLRIFDMYKMLNERKSFTTIINDLLVNMY